MEIAAGKDDEAAVQGPCVFAGLFFSNQGILVFGFGFQNDERETLGVE